jgi:hypothetical protein
MFCVLICIYIAPSFSAVVVFPYIIASANCIIIRLKVVISLYVLCAALSLNSYINLFYSGIVLLSFFILLCKLLLS